jgi:hypothetical protein
VILWLANAALVLAPSLLGTTSGTEDAYFRTYILNFDGSIAVRSVESVLPTLGFFLAPFAVAMLLRRRSDAARGRVWVWVLPLLGVAGLTWSVLTLVGGQSVLPGDVWSVYGFAPTLLGAKPLVFPPAIELPLELVSIATFVALTAAARDAWSRSALGPGLFLAIAAVVQTAVVIPTFIFDRYYLVPAALLVPVLAAAATRGRLPALAAGWAVAVAVAGLGLYAVGEQDYQAWQQARDEAARLAYQIEPPELVHAGYEANAMYAILPEFERTGTIDFRHAHDFLIVGPEYPVLMLVYSTPDDTRLGAGYDSVAPGRIVVIRRRPPDNPPGRTTP